MKSPKTFSVTFWLKKRSIRPNGHIPIYARIHVEGVRVDLSVKRSTLESDWCLETSRLNPRIKGSENVNFYLDEVYANLIECHRQLYFEGKPISAQAIKSRYLGTDKSLDTLCDIIKYHWEVESTKLEKGTLKNYNATEKYLKRFIRHKYKKDDLHLNFIDYQFIVEFEQFLRTTPSLKASQPLSNNGIMKHMERFQKLINIAVKLGCIITNPFNMYSLKFENYDSDFLEPEELKCLNGFNSNDSSLMTVKDMFLFACYTGLSYIEIKSLTKEGIVEGVDGKLWIDVRRKKTKTKVKVPLLPQALEILNKYLSNAENDRFSGLLPVFSNQTVNKYLKTIIKEVDIDKNITFHVARHTFATTVTLLNDVPLETVSKLLGHTKLSTTQKYARVMEKKISKDISRLKQVLKENEHKNNVKPPKFESVHLRIV
ncbi:site-specific integrase [Pseudotamlana agarivorans]|uniref:site-specific integrase n=1 Tax=Pseudotamlana agarivorans TaxID=481183 RepID=UPI0008338E3D|nr:site-specific integrase [Tamlana agarivorans]